MSFQEYNTDIVLQEEIVMGKDVIIGEIGKEWSKEAFQNVHREARAQIWDYMRELDARREKKSGYGFLRYMEDRMKTPESIAEKLQRKSYPVDFQTAVEKLNDISGVRVICYSLKEVYWVAKQIARDERYTIVKFKDYIRKPKKSGYESYHLVLEVPVKGEDGITSVRVELQLRTIIMDAWTAVDNRISYKKSASEEMTKRVEKYAKIGRRLDKLIQRTLDEM